MDKRKESITVENSLRLGKTADEKDKSLSATSVTEETVKYEQKVDKVHDNANDNLYFYCPLRFSIECVLSVKIGVLVILTLFNDEKFK